jgi:hypothetical protein
VNLGQRGAAVELAGPASLLELELGDLRPFDEAALVKREVVDRLSRGGRDGRPATALIVTHGGKRSEKPLAVIVSDDLPRLNQALLIT